MPKYRVTSPDGAIFDVDAPEGASEADAIAYVQGQQQQPGQLTQRQSFNRAIMGAAPFVGQAAPDMLMGMRQLLDAGAQLAARGLESATSPESSVGKWARTQRAETERVNKEALEQYKANFGQPPGADIARGAGQALLTAPAVAFRAATTIPGMALQGGAQGGIAGALTPVYDAGDDFWSKKAEQAKGGATLGAVLSGGLGTLGKALSPAKEAKQLTEAGINPTWAQSKGGILKSLEEKAASIPIVGDVMRYANLKSLEEFNRAIYNRILKPLGEKYEGPVGQKGIAKVGDRLSAAYDEITAKIVRVDVDDDFVRSMLELKQMAANLPKERSEQFNSVIQRDVWNRLTESGTASGEIVKQIESRLGTMYRAYKGNPDGDKRMLADAFRQAQENVRSLIARQYPEHAPRLQAINEGWRNLTQLELAAQGTKVARQEGLVTPADYLKGINKSDFSPRDRRMSRGEMANQEFAQAADRFLSNKYPDSGTAARLATGGALMTGGGLTVSPMIPVGMAAATIPYLPGVRNAIGGAGLLGDPMARIAPYLGGAAPAGLLDLYP